MWVPTVAMTPGSYDHGYYPSAASDYAPGNKAYNQTFHTNTLGVATFSQFDWLSRAPSVNGSAAAD